MLNNKKILGTILAGSLVFGSLTPALADGAASVRNILIGAGAVYLIQSNHNRHVKQDNEDIYRHYGTFWHNGNKYNCHYANGGKVCYKLVNNHWNYVNPN